MDPEKLNINFADGEGVKELIIREVDTVVEEKLPVLEPDKVSISGNITAIFAFLEKRWNAEDSQVDHCRTHILVDRDNLQMTLVVNETDKREKKTVVGTIQLSRQYTAFGVNNKLWESTDLGNFFRINRSYFEKKETNMSLVSLLKRFTAKVNTEVEREEKDNGSVTDVYRKVVDANLPPETLEFIGLNVTCPLVADPVSAIKGQRLRPILHHVLSEYFPIKGWTIIPIRGGRIQKKLS